MKKSEIAIIMGSDSDLEIMKEAAKKLEEFNVAYEISIVSAHRTPELMYKFAKNAEEKGIKIIIAGAGGSAHLPGMTASLTNVPVIGVPIKTKNLDGLDSLLSIVQMPKGVPVATVAINGAENAALLALKILGISDDNIKRSLSSYKNSTEKKVLDDSARLNTEGYKKYFK